jgi:hypothetical protein
MRRKTFSLVLICILTFNCFFLVEYCCASGNTIYVFTKKDFTHILRLSNNLSLAPSFDKSV